MKKTPSLDFTEQNFKILAKMHSVCCGDYLNRLIKKNDLDSVKEFLPLSKAPTAGTMRLAIRNADDNNFEILYELLRATKSLPREVLSDFLSHHLRLTDSAVRCLSLMSRYTSKFSVVIRSEYPSRAKETDAQKLKNFARALNLDDHVRRYINTLLDLEDQFGCSWEEAHELALNEATAAVLTVSYAETLHDFAEEMTQLASTTSRKNTRL